jgi:ribosomal protein S18 acetylase RimI-like enzyme
MTQFSFRNLEMYDTQRIQEIYSRITATNDLEEEILVEIIDGSLASIGVEQDGILVGFVLGEVRKGAFGETESVGWINMIGVDPEYRGKSLGKKLGEEILQHFKGLGINRIRTIVKDDDYQLLGYFKSIGLQKVDWTVLETNI